MRLRCFLLFVALAAHAWASPPDSAAADLHRIHAMLTDAKTPRTWVFTGDSITQGAKWLGHARSYSQIIEERIRWELGRTHDIVINSGVSGEVMSGLLVDYDWRVGRFHPDVVSVMMGMNDCRYGNAGLSRFTAQLKELIRRIRAQGAIPVLNSTTQIDTSEPDARGLAALPAYNMAIRTVAAEEHVIYVDHWTLWVAEHPRLDARGSWLANPIHPGPLGHRQIAITWLKALDLYDPRSRSCER